MSTKRYKVAELQAWYKSLSTIHREHFKVKANNLIDRWVLVHNAEGMLTAMQQWKHDLRPFAPIQRAVLDWLLQRTIRNGAHFSLPTSVPRS